MEPTRSAQQDSPESPPPAPRRPWTERLTADAVADVLLFIATVNLLSLPLAGGISLSLGGRTVGGPSPALSLVSWLALVAFRFRAAWLGRAPLAAAGSWLRRHPFPTLLGIVTVAGFALRVASIDFGMPLVVHVDEPSVVGVAVEQLRSGWIDPQWYVYPTFFMNLMLPALAIYFVYARGHGLIDPIDQVQSTAPGFYLVGRYHSALLGTLNIPLTYWLGQKLYGQRRGTPAGLIAAVIVAFSFIHVRESHFAVTDAPTAAVVTAALVAIAGVLRDGRPRDYVAAGFLCGLAASTKYTAAPVALSFVLAHLFGRPVRAWHRQPLWSGVAAVPAGFIFGSPYALLNWKPFLDHLAWLSGFAGNPSTEQVRDNFVSLVGYGMESGFGALVFVLLSAAIGRAIYRRRPPELLLVAFIGGSIPQMTQTTHAFYPRFLVPLVPAAALLVGGLLVDAFEGVRARRALPPQAATAALFVALVMLPWQGARESLQWVRVHAHQDTRAAAYEWIRARYPEGAVIASETPIIGAPRAYRVLDWQGPFETFEADAFLREEVDVVILSADYDPVAVAADREPARRALRRTLGEAARFEGLPRVERPGPTIEVFVVPRSR